jgi:hypothetical protein
MLRINPTRDAEQMPTSTTAGGNLASSATWMPKLRSQAPSLISYNIVMLPLSVDAVTCRFTTLERETDEIDKQTNEMTKGYEPELLASSVNSWK